MIETAQGFAILYLDSRIPADREEFEKDKDQYKEAVLNRKRNEILTDYLTKLRMKANLESNLVQEIPTN